LNTQTVKPSSPVELYENISQTYPTIQPIVRNMYRLFFYFLLYRISQ
jgi:hypothetical protein